MANRLPPISRLLRHAGGYVGPILHPRTHRGRANFEDQLLLENLEYGFPLCMNKQALTYNVNVVNHPSASQLPKDIDAYFEKEIKHKAIVGPYNNIPFPVHYSPLLSSPKANDTFELLLILAPLMAILSTTTFTMAGMMAHHMS